MKSELEKLLTRIKRSNEKHFKYEDINILINDCEAFLKKLFNALEVEKELVEDLEDKYCELISKYVDFEIALKSIANNACCDTCQEAKLIAEKALNNN